MVFSKIKVNACISYTLSVFINFWGIILKYPIWLILHFYPYIPSNQFVFTIPHFFLSQGPTIVHAWKSSIQVFPTKSDLFSSTSIDPTLNPLPLVIVFMLYYMYWLDKRGHYMWWYFTCKRFSLFETPYIKCMIFLQNLSTMYIVDPIFYRMLFLRFLPVTPPRKLT